MNSSVPPLQLVKGVKYFFDDYSKDCGTFHDIIQRPEGHKSVRFVPVSNNKYATYSGLVSFRFEEEMKFYKKR